MPLRKLRLPTKPKWQDTCERFVGFIDIMGFKDMVSRWTHKQVFEKLKVISEFRSNDTSEPIFSKNAVKLFIFSDSVIMFSIDGSEPEMQELKVHAYAY